MSEPNTTPEPEENQQETGTNLNESAASGGWNDGGWNETLWNGVKS